MYCALQCGLSSCLLFLSPHPLFTLAHLPFITVIIIIIIIIVIIIVVIINVNILVLLLLLIIIIPMMTFPISVLLCLQTPTSTLAHP